MPRFDPLNDCGKKSNITYTANTYHTIFYGNDRKLLADDTGIYKLEGDIITVHARSKDSVSSTKITTQQKILEQTDTKLVLKDALTGGVITLVKRDKKQKQP